MSETAAREEDEFAFPLPAGWIDVSTPEKAAQSPLVVPIQRNGHERFIAVKPDTAARLQVRVQPGLLRLTPRLVDALSLALLNGPGARALTRELVTLSKTSAVKVVVVCATSQVSLFVVPGRVRTAYVQGSYAPDDDEVASVIERFATEVAISAETAPPTWTELERQRDQDGTRSTFGLKLAGAGGIGAMAGAIATGVAGLDVAYGAIGGAALALIATLAWLVKRGRAPMLPGGGAPPADE